MRHLKGWRDLISADVLVVVVKWSWAWAAEGSLLVLPLCLLTKGMWLFNSMGEEGGRSPQPLGAGGTDSGKSGKDAVRPFRETDIQIYSEKLQGEKCHMEFCPSWGGGGNLAGTVMTQLAWECHLTLPHSGIQGPSGRPSVPAQALRTSLVSDRGTGVGTKAEERKQRAHLQGGLSTMGRGIKQGAYLAGKRGKDKPAKALPDSLTAPGRS